MGINEKLIDNQCYNQPEGGRTGRKIEGNEKSFTEQTALSGMDNNTNYRTH